MPEVFTWPTEVGAAGEISFRVRKAQFGDGYAQAVGDGINNRAQRWPVTVWGGLEEVQPAVDFLDAHAGFKSFLWTSPKGQGLYRCESYTLTPGPSDSWSLVATFEEHFGP
ncbi:MAG TPA: phage tail protein [Lysobacter sp.]